MKVDGSCQPPSCEWRGAAAASTIFGSTLAVWDPPWATTAGDESAVEGSRLATKVEAAPTVKDACPEISGWGSELEGLETSKKNAVKNTKQKTGSAV